MRGVWAFIVPFFVAGALAVVVWVAGSGRSQPSGAPVDADVATLGLEGPRYVRLRGTAHYASDVAQRVAGGLLREPATYHLFGFFPEGDLTGREVRVLVRTLRPPERLVSYEFLTIEGVVGPLDAKKVGVGVRDAIARNEDYWLDEDAVLVEPIRIVSEDGAWLEP